MQLYLKNKHRKTDELLCEAKAMRRYGDRARYLQTLNEKLAQLDAEIQFLSRQRRKLEYDVMYWKIQMKSKVEDFVPRFAQFRETLSAQDQEMIKVYEVELLVHLRALAFEKLNAEYPDCAIPDCRPAWMRLSMEQKRQQIQSIADFFARQRVKFMLLQALKTEVHQCL